MFILIAYVVITFSLILLDAYIQGRFKITIFAENRDQWEREPSIYFWPLYYISLIVYYASIGIYKLICRTINFCHIKGKQANDIDYQIEKHIKGK